MLALNRKNNFGKLFVLFCVFVCCPYVGFDSSFLPVKVEVVIGLINRKFLFRDETKRK